MTIVDWGLLILIVVLGWKVLELAGLLNKYAQINDKEVDELRQEIERLKDAEFFQPT